MKLIISGEFVKKKKKKRVRVKSMHFVSFNLYL